MAEQLGVGGGGKRGASAARQQLRDARIACAACDSAMTTERSLAVLGADVRAIRCALARRSARPAAAALL